MNLKGTCENWSRVVLEAFSAGVPVVADARGGYVEQIEHERTGLLCDTPVDFADAITRLENNEDFRQQIVRNARESLSTLADPEAIGNAWEAIFENLADIT
jgi:glycosyltransferase involved in cell wall biosynthesis